MGTHTIPHQHVQNKESQLHLQHHVQARIPLTKSAGQKQVGNGVQVFTIVPPTSQPSLEEHYISIVDKKPLELYYCNIESYTCTVTQTTAAATTTKVKETRKMSTIMYVGEPNACNHCIHKRCTIEHSHKIEEGMTH